MTSINGFYLSKKREFEGRDGMGYEAVLKYHGKTVCAACQYGDGGAASVSSLTGDPSCVNALVSTLDRIFKELDSKHLHTDDLKQAALAMISLLFDLGDLTGQIQRHLKQTNDQWAVVRAFGQSWFRDKTVLTTFYRTAGGTDRLDGIPQFMRELREEYSTAWPLYRGEPLVALLLHNRGDGFDFSTSGYIDIYRPSLDANRYDRGLEKGEVTNAENG